MTPERIHVGEERLARSYDVAEHPVRATMHTWTDPENHAMYATNTAFGYQPVERLHEVQVKD